MTFAGYVADVEIDDYLAASDVCLCMRWPTSRETSASWLRCLAAGKPTISTDLVHTADVPTLDPRNWSVLDARLKSRPTEQKLPTEELLTEPEPHAEPIGPVGVSIDILDEDHSLKLAMRRLVDRRTASRRCLGRMRGRSGPKDSGWSEWWRDTSVAIARALQTSRTGPDARATLPQHLRASGAERAESLVKEILGSEYHLRDAD